MTLLDGGVRSLGIISGGYLPPSEHGKRYQGLAHVVDLSATVLAAAGLFPAQTRVAQAGRDGFAPIVAGYWRPRENRSPHQHCQQGPVLQRHSIWQVQANR
ncbi:hypothetical protein BASA81_004125 [Batrachochytrium salamandrivorans]|nr:hypothetical protein BASA81_004125 [Batrachochytrium salamandrivorans]